MRAAYRSASRAHFQTPCSCASYFRRYFFDLARAAQKVGSPPPTNNVVVSPVVRMLGPDHALIAYVRVTQSGGNVSAANETRVWKREPGGSWKNVHFHRSPCPKL